MAFVATRRVGVGPGVKMDIARSVKKAAMIIAIADIFSGLRCVCAQCFATVKCWRGLWYAGPMSRWGSCEGGTIVAAGQDRIIKLKYKE